jgi:hypothetical protein
LSLFQLLPCWFQLHFTFLILCWQPLMKELHTL